MWNTLPRIEKWHIYLPFRGVYIHTSHVCVHMYMYIIYERGWALVGLYPCVAPLPALQWPTGAPAWALRCFASASHHAGTNSSPACLARESLQNGTVVFVSSARCISSLVCWFFLAIGLYSNTFFQYSLRCAQTTFFFHSSEKAWVDSDLQMQPKR